MELLLKYKKDLIEYVQTLNDKYELSKVVEADYFEPGSMENLDQYKGEYNRETNTLIIKVDSKGLRYDNRTQNLERIFKGDAVDIMRQADNEANLNNFTVSKNRESLGNLPAGLCNVLAPLYDKGYAHISSATVSYIEKIGERSRYAQKGVLFLEINIDLDI